MTVIETIARAIAWKRLLKSSVVAAPEPDDVAYLDATWPDHVPLAQSVLTAIDAAGMVVVSREALSIAAYEAEAAAETHNCKSCEKAAAALAALAAAPEAGK